LVNHSFSQQKKIKMKKILGLILGCAFIFFQCQKEPIPTEVTVRLVNNRGVPIVGHEMSLLKQYPSSGGIPNKKDNIVEKKLTDSKGEVVFTYIYQVYESQAEHWFVVPKEAEKVLPLNFYRHEWGQQKPNVTIIVDSIVPIRVRYKNATANTIFITTGAVNTSASTAFSRQFGGHEFNLGATKDTTVTINGYARSNIEMHIVRNRIGTGEKYLYNGSLVRDSVFLITLN
jgi:hypothetical protein